MPEILLKAFRPPLGAAKAIAAAMIVPVFVKEMRQALTFLATIANDDKACKLWPSSRSWRCSRLAGPPTQINY
jgi:hypothetical protein